jgi:transcriptional regulator with XRE-family HTH domain
VLTSGSMTFVTFGERVLKACVLRGMTLGDLEREAKLSRGYASRISRDERGGKRPSRTTVEKIAAALRVDPDWLADEKGPAPTSKTFVEAPDRYPHRAEAARIARDGGVDAEAIQSVLQDRYDGDDLSVLEWLHRIERRHYLLRRDVPGTEVDEGEPPPMGRGR